MENSPTKLQAAVAASTKKITGENANHKTLTNEAKAYMFLITILFSSLSLMLPSTSQSNLFSLKTISLHHF
jgi:hypothetical protein